MKYPFIWHHVPQFNEEFYGKKKKNFLLLVLDLLLENRHVGSLLSKLFFPDIFVMTCFY